MVISHSYVSLPEGKQHRNLHVMKSWKEGGGFYVHPQVD